RHHVLGRQLANTLDRDPLFAGTRRGGGDRLLNRLLDVVARDRTVRAAAGHRVQVDAEVLGELADRRLGQRAFHDGGRLWLFDDRRRGGRGPRAALGRRGPGTVADENGRPPARRGTTDQAGLDRALGGRHLDRGHRLRR